MIICFTGIDGSGKSMQAYRLVDRLNAAGHPARYIWSGGRNLLSRPLIQAAKRLLRAPRRARGAPAPTDSAPGYTTYLASTRKLFAYPSIWRMWREIGLIEHVAQIWAEIVPELAAGRIVVCDRYIYDSIIGTAVLAGLTPAELVPELRLPRYYPLPQPLLWFYLDVPASVAFARKDDVVALEFLERRVPLYQALADQLGMLRLDGTAPPDVIGEQVWARVWPLLAARGAVARGSRWA